MQRNQEEKINVGELWISSSLVLNDDLMKAVFNIK